MTQRAEVVVRAAGPPDAAAVAALYRPYVTSSVVSFEQEPPDAREMTRRMLQPRRLPWLLALRAGAPVGYCCASAHRSRPGWRWTVEVSVYLRADERGRGTGRALYGVLLPEVRRLGYVTALAVVTLPNHASVRLHEALGFSPVGVLPAVGHKHGAWHDVGTWRLPLVDPPQVPAEPVPWDPGQR